jgi:hypothetical protein
MANPDLMESAALRLARLETADGRQHFALLGDGPAGSFNLFVAGILLGKKVRVILLQRGYREHPIGIVQVLRTVQVSAELYENGAIIEQSF